jgi:acetyltransferase-like isoleucine patch superfamily enzyme
MELKSIGQDVRIDKTVIIKYPQNVFIDDHVAIDSFVVITTSVKIGKYVHIAPHCTIIGGQEALLVMEDFSGFSAGCRIVCASDDYKGFGLINPTVPIEYRVVHNDKVIIRKYATLGTNVVIHPGVEIGEGCVVGSGSVVTKDLEPWGIYIGTPARKIGQRESSTIIKYAKKLLGDKL